MNTTVKLLVTALGLCSVPAAFAMSLEQAAANLAGAKQFSHLADKVYSTALYNERAANLALSNTAFQYGNNSAEAQRAALAHDAALAQVARARQDARIGRVQVDAALRAFRDGSIAPVATPTPTPAPALVAVPPKQPVATPGKIPQPINVPRMQSQAVPPKIPQLPVQKTPQPMNVPPMLSQAVPYKVPPLPVQKTPLPLSTVYSGPTTQIVTANPQSSLVAGLPKGTIINPQKPLTHSVTIIDNTPKTTASTLSVTKVDNGVQKPTTTVSTSQKGGATYNITTVNQVNSFYVTQQNSRQVTDNSQRIDHNSQQIANNSQRIDRNQKEIDDTRDDLKRGLNNAAAMSSLHYHSDNAWALSTGTANGDGAALAGGLQKGITSHVAVNMQASTSFDSGWMAGAGISGDF